jgi:hypothetical protein
MPDLRLKEVHLPELRLPEMSREDIARAIGDARRDVDLGRFDPRRMDTPDVDLPAIDLSRIDLPKAVANASAAIGLARTSRLPRIPRLPLVIGGLVTLAVVGYAILTSPFVKPRLTEMARRAREMAEERRAARQDADSPRAFDAAVAVPVEPSAYTDTAPDGGSPFDGPSALPDGLGAGVHEEAPARSQEPAGA